eukprot:6265007-Alexandrium_andersonii.AAC.1
MFRHTLRPDHGFRGGRGLKSTQAYPVKFGREVGLLATHAIQGNNECANPKTPVLRTLPTFAKLRSLPAVDWGPAALGDVAMAVCARCPHAEAHMRVFTDAYEYLFGVVPDLFS